MTQLARLEKIAATLATFGPIGYCIAPGTVATLLFAPLALFLRIKIPHVLLYGLLLAASIYGALFCVKQALLKLNRRDDPSEIVIDEALGTLFVFWGLPLSIFSVVGAILLFRIFDIFKPFGIARLESCGVEWGILLDDIAAGLISNIIIRIIIFYVV